MLPKAINIPLPRSGLATAAAVTAFVLLSCVPCARAQEAGAGGEVVRVRRVSRDAAGEEIEALRAKAEGASNPSERARLRLSLAEALAEGGSREEAVALVRDLLSEERFDPQLFYNAGNALARMGESEAAAEASRKAVAQKRGN